MRRNAALILILWSLFAYIVCGNLAWGMAPKETGAQTKSEQHSIAPGDMHEVCMILTPRETVRYALTATGKLSFNIHYHVGNEIYFPVPEYLTSEAKGSFAPALQQNYCFMWTNPGSSAVKLRLEYEKRAKTSLRRGGQSQEEIGVRELEILVDSCRA